MNEDFSADLLAVSRIDAVDRILEVISRTTGLGFSAVARVTESRWIACAVRDEIAFGLGPGGELVVDTTICDEIRNSGTLVVIDDVHNDPHFVDHPTPKQYGFRSYISVPIVLPNGSFFGTLCAIDPRPASLKRPEIIEMFKLFANMLGLQLQTELQLVANESALASTKQALLDERETSQLREQFIAVLGHDLRNPLGAIQNGIIALQMSPSAEDLQSVSAMMSRSVGRMSELIQNVLDLARRRLGGTFTIAPTFVSDLDSVLSHVVHEMMAIHPTRNVDARISVRARVHCDSGRLSQLLSNLLANALTYGDATAPVEVVAAVQGSELQIAVSNKGPVIPKGKLNTLFRPFFRGSSETDPHGLGLGLYIASEIARAHNGTLAARSEDGRTEFVFRMPLA